MAIELLGEVADACRCASVATGNGNGSKQRDLLIARIVSNPRRAPAASAHVTWIDDDNVPRK